MIHGVGLGFRKEMAKEILGLDCSQLAFVELAPENWMGVGAKYKKMLSELVEKFPVLCHGLSLSLGSPEPLDMDLLKKLKAFFSKIPVRLYSEHLSFSKADNAHSIELHALPFTEEAVDHAVSRIKQVQDFLERTIAIENVCYHCSSRPEMEEAEFISRVVEESGCSLLLDINNLFINAFNHDYDAYAFLQKIPLDKISCLHMAGHERITPNKIVDSHSRPIVDPVYRLFEWTVQRIQPVPALLERDVNFEDFNHLIAEVETLQVIINKHWSFLNAAR